MNISRHWMAISAAAAVAFGFSSCTYDPYYSSAGGYYSSGYGHGYGYGGSNFSTSFFVSTGDPRWGYDPYTYCYYDYRSRRYYDPYLYGYYPIGYRPPILSGVPHPHGWRPGRGYLPPPRTVRNVTVTNYRDRAAAYRRSDYSWSNRVHIKPDSRIRPQRQTPDDSTRLQDRRRAPSTWSTPGSRQRSQDFAPTSRQRSRENRAPVFDSAVTDASPRRAASAQRQSAERSRTRPYAQPSHQGRTHSVTPSRSRVTPAETPSGSRHRDSQDASEPSQTKERRGNRTLRSLGQE